MAKRMLIDATHPEQTRVAVVDGHRLEEYDFETESRKQLKGNIYLAKVIRIEPSLQAAFVEYGGNRHGFLAFTEIHHDYYRIPVADRQQLEAAIAEERAMSERQFENETRDHYQSSADDNTPFIDEEIHEDHITHSALPPAIGLGAPEQGLMMDPFSSNDEGVEELDATHDPDQVEGDLAELPEVYEGPEVDNSDEGLEAPEGIEQGETPVEMVGGDEVVETQREQRRRRFIRRYKIQEVIKRGQIMLIQVVKEERGNKGAALTTYLSLAGRYCVLMPNTDKGGGISRKITSMQDRRRMKELLDQLDIPGGMACILRTAGMERSKVEVKRDLEYLLRLWDSIREATLKSIAPSVIYEEANLIKRAMRDLYTPDIENILVEGEEGYERARDFMRMLMPTHARRVHHYHDHVIPLFFRYQVENQINALHSPVVQLKSGGYIVINQTEALVAIDVNSGRATRERNIEETALRTNTEAAEEVARQLRLRDLAGLIVIDFIDMEDNRNNAAVERRIKESMRHDRARLQIGRISHFGLLELSRQRLRPSLIDLNFEKCQHCQGTGYIRLVESTAVLALHAIEEEGIRQTAAEITIGLPTNAAHYIMNNKRELLAGIERRYGMLVKIKIREEVIPPEFPIERIRNKRADEQISMNMVSEQQLFAAAEGEAIPHEETEYGVAISTLGEGDDRFGSEGGEENAGRGEGRSREGNREGGRDGARGGRRRGRRGGRRRSGGRDGAPGAAPRFRDGVEQDNTSSVPYEGGSEDGAVFVTGGEGIEGGEPREARPPREPREPRPEGERAPREGRDRGRGGRRGGRGGRDRDNRGPRDAAPRDAEGNIVPREPREVDGNREGGNTAPREGQREGNRDGRDRNRGGGDRRPRRDGPREGGREGGNRGGERYNNQGDNRGNYAPRVDVPVNVLELDTTPRDDRGSNSQLANQGLDVAPEKKKSGWWQRLTGA